MSFKSIYFGLLNFTSNSNSSYLTVLRSHYFATCSSPQLRYLSYLGTSFLFTFTAYVNTKRKVINSVQRIILVLTYVAIRFSFIRPSSEIGSIRCEDFNTFTCELCNGFVIRYIAGLLPYYSSQLRSIVSAWEQGQLWGFDFRKR
jgi:hypothetical protein